MVTQSQTRPASKPAAPEVEPSRLLDYLPALYRDQDERLKLAEAPDPDVVPMGQFLRIFESILNPLENTVDNLALYFDPRLTPEPVLPWLASWLDLALDSNWPLSRRRELVRRAAELYRWRGTRRGLSEYLRIYTGTQPQIIEYIPGMILDAKTRLGENTVLGSSGAGHHFTVILEIPPGEIIDPRVVRQIIESQKPAHTVYTLKIK